MRIIRFSVVIMLIAGCAGQTKLYHFPERTTGMITPPSAVKSQSVNRVVVPEVLTASAKTDMLPVDKPSKSGVKIKAERTVQKKSPVLKRLFNDAEAAKRSVGLSGLDQDLKFSIIFSVAGFVSLVLMVLSKIFGILGGLGLIVGVVFFTKWLLEQ
jgi:hypothetical protein